MAGQNQLVTGGVDTHKDVHVAAAIDEVGAVLGTASFDTTSTGYHQLLAWMADFGEIDKVGVEGTGSYGAGLTRYLASQGVTVIEVNRPNRQMRRRRGKSDTVDATAAARAALNGEADVAPKTRAGIVESIRVLRVAFCSARQARTQAGLQIRDLIVTAPEPLRAALGPASTAKRVETAARFRPGDPCDPTQATRESLRALARRYEALSAEMAELDAALDTLTAQANPAFRGARGVGPDVAAILLVAVGDNPSRMRNEAAFAAMCAASPVEASSGKVVRHRLNRGGNRQANHALWRIVMIRMTCDPETQAYVARRRAEGKSLREIVRCLKRYVAREVYHLLTDPPAVPNGAELRSARNVAGISLATAAGALGTWATRISELERSISHDAELANRYQLWLATLNAA